MCVCAAVFPSRHLDNEALGIHHPDLLQTLLLSQSLLLHGHGDQLSDAHRRLGARQKETVDLRPQPCLSL